MTKPRAGSASIIALSETPDIVVLHISRGERALPVMRVIIGGVASRQNLPLDRLDDLQLAVETLLAEEAEEGGELGLALSTIPGGFNVRLDGLENQSVKATLVADNPFEPCEGCLLDVRLLLDSLVDGYRIVEGAGGSYAVEMERRAS